MSSCVAAGEVSGRGWGLAGDDVLDRGDHLVGGDAEVLEDLRGRAAFAEAVDADDRAFQADVLAPVAGHARLDGDARDAARQHVVAVGRVAGAGDGDQVDAQVRLPAAYRRPGIGHAPARVDIVGILLGGAPAFEQGRRAQGVLQLLGERVGAVGGERQARIAAARAKARAAAEAQSLDEDF